MIMRHLRNWEFVKSMYLHFRFTTIFTSRNCVKCVNQPFLANVFFTDIAFTIEALLSQEVSSYRHIDLRNELLTNSVNSLSSLSNFIY